MVLKVIGIVRRVELIGKQQQLNVFVVDYLFFENMYKEDVEIWEDYVEMVIVAIIDDFSNEVQQVN